MSGTYIGKVMSTVSASTTMLISSIVDHIKWRRGEVKDNYINGYKVKRFLGSGVQGKVFEVVDQYGNTFAMKIKHLDEFSPSWEIDDLKLRLEKLKSIDHENIVGIHQYGTIDTSNTSYLNCVKLLNTPQNRRDNILTDSIPDYALRNGKCFYTLMEYVDGHEVRYISNSVSQDVKLAKRELEQHDITHDDIRESNILYNSKTGKYVLIDFD